MRFENGNGVKGFGDVNHNDHKKPSGRMSYITVTENAVKWWITVQGLNHHEVSCVYERFAACTFVLRGFTSPFFIASRMLHGDWIWKARHQGLHLDHAQGQGGVGCKYSVSKGYILHCNPS